MSQENNANLASQDGQTVPSAQVDTHIQGDYGDGGLSYSEIEDLLNFTPKNTEPDVQSAPPAAQQPAAQPEGGQQPAQPVQGQTEPGAQQQGAAANAQQLQGQQPQAQPPQASPEQLQIQQLQAELASLKASPQQQQQQQQQTEPGSDAPTGLEVPEYKYDIPQELTQMIFSDDPMVVQKGIGALAQGVSQTVHQTVMDKVVGIMDAVLPQFFSEMFQTVQSQNQVRTDFHSAHPDLAKPELAPLVSSVAQQVMNQYPNLAWGPELSNLIATQVRGIIGTVPGSAQPTVNQQPPAPQQPVPQHTQFVQPQYQAPAQPVAQVPAGQSGANGAARPQGTQNDVGSQILEMMNTQF